MALTPTRLLYSTGNLLLPPRLTLQHFRFVLASSPFPVYFKNSLIVSLSTAIAVTALAAFAGYALSRFRFRGKTPFMLVLLATQLFPLVIIIAPIFRIFAPLHLTNSIWGLVVVYTAFNVAFANFLMQSFFDGIPKELDEAAMIDGCSRLQALVLVVFPLTLPGVSATLGFVFTAAWSELLFALMLINSESQKTFAGRTADVHLQVQRQLGADDGRLIVGADPRHRLLRAHQPVSGPRAYGWGRQGLRFLRPIGRRKVHATGLDHQQHVRRAGVMKASNVAEFDVGGRHHDLGPLDEVAHQEVRHVNGGRR